MVEHARETDENSTIFRNRVRSKKTLKILLKNFGRTGCSDTVREWKPTVNPVTVGVLFDEQPRQAMMFAIWSLKNYIDSVRIVPKSSGLYCYRPKVAQVSLSHVSAGYLRNGSICSC